MNKLQPDQRIDPLYAQYCFREKTLGPAAVPLAAYGYFRNRGMRFRPKNTLGICPNDYVRVDTQVWTGNGYETVPMCYPKEESVGGFYSDLPPQSPYGRLHNLTPCKYKTKAMCNIPQGQMTSTHSQDPPGIRSIGTAPGTCSNKDCPKNWLSSCC